MTICSKKQVEQVNSKGNIVLGYGKNLSPNELQELFNKEFKTEKDETFSCIGEYKGKRFCICFKNVSYLGNPHPINKKRIQIPETFVTKYSMNNAIGITTFYIGVYTFEDNTIFVNFDTKNYVTNKAHNSSAHVLAIDLSNATIHGIYEKNDVRGNTITVFDKKNIDKFFESKLLNKIDLKAEALKVLDDFFVTLPEVWKGIECYQEMIDANFNQKFQPEWPGFYLEFKLSEYIKANHVENVIHYVQNKKSGQIDLDLFFPEFNSFGDLKAHSSSSNAIQGNDYDTIMKVVEKYPIYYVVVDHDTKKDKDNGFEVTRFWNTIQSKDDLMSYANKMKSEVIIKDFMVLEINKNNVRYLDIFEQGINSNGKPRNKKILIKNKNLENFVIYQETKNK